MRDLLVLLAFAILIPAGTVIPVVGGMAWGWISFMNPHREAFGFAYYFGWNLYVAATAILGWMISSEPKRIPINKLSIIMILIILWMTLSCILSMAPGISWQLYDRVIKIFAFMFFVLGLFNTKVRIHGMIWLIALSIGYWGIRGAAAFALGGGANFTGPPRSLIGDRNHLAVALIMALPLINYLRTNSVNKLIKLGCLGAMMAIVLSVIATNSRAGLMTLVASGGFFWLVSRPKVSYAAMIFVAIILMIPFIPQSWFDRMQTIGEATEEDASLRGRFEAWITAYNSAKARPTGAGLRAIQKAHVFAIYGPKESLIKESHARAAHSVYFEVLGDMGFPGFFLYLYMLGTGFINCRYVARKSKRIVQLAWMHNLSLMIQVSLVGFMAGGASVSLAYFGMLFGLLAVASNLRDLCDKSLVELEEKKKAELEGPRSYDELDSLAEAEAHADARQTGKRRRRRRRSLARKKPSWVGAGRRDEGPEGALAGGPPIDHEMIRTEDSDPFTHSDRNPRKDDE